MRFRINSSLERVLFGTLPSKDGFIVLNPVSPSSKLEAPWTTDDLGLDFSPLSVSLLLIHL